MKTTINLAFLGEEKNLAFMKFTLMTSIPSLLSPIPGRSTSVVEELSKDMLGIIVTDVN